MSLSHAVIVVLAGVFAGTINTIVGSGTLVTFPALLLLGYPAVTANVSNNIGLVAGGVTGAWGYRSEIKGSRRYLARLAPMSFLGSVVGALLLLTLPASAFSAIVPVLIAIGLLLVVFGPALQRRFRHDESDGPEPSWTRWAMLVGVFVAGVYGGYFGAAQGVILMGLLSALSAEPLQRLNGWKNVLSLVVNLVAALVFVIVAFDRINWLVALLIGVGSFVGGFIGASVGRRIPPMALRGLILLIGIVAIVKLVFFP